MAIKKESNGAPVLRLPPESAAMILYLDPAQRGLGVSLQFAGRASETTFAKAILKEAEADIAAALERAASRVNMEGKVKPKWARATLH